MSKKDSVNLKIDFLLWRKQKINLLSWMEVKESTKVFTQNKHFVVHVLELWYVWCLSSSSTFQPLQRTEGFVEAILHWVAKW